jgi:hypothetical protein
MVASAGAWGRTSMFVPGAATRAEESGMRVLKSGWGWGGLEGGGVKSVSEGAPGEGPMRSPGR